MDRNSVAPWCLIASYAGACVMFIVAIQKPVKKNWLIASAAVIVIAGVILFTAKP